MFEKLICNFRGHRWGLWAGFITAAGQITGTWRCRRCGLTRNGEEPDR